MALVLLCAVLGACGGPPEPQHPEMLQDGQSFRPLTMVPERPQVRVPLGDRQLLEDELRENNKAARLARVHHGFAEPTLPPDEPDMPMELPDAGEEETGE